MLSSMEGTALVSVHQRKRNTKEFQKREELIVLLEEWREIPFNEVPAPSPYKRPKWCTKLQFESEAEKVQFVETLLVFLKDPNFPFLLFKPTYLYDWYKELQKREAYEPFEPTTIQEELRQFWEYHRKFCYGDPFEKYYELLLYMPAKWLGFYVKHYYNDKVRPKSNLYEAMTDLTFEEVMGLIELAKVTAYYQNIDYLEIGVPLLKQIEPSWLEELVEEFIGEVLPLILEKTEIVNTANKELLRIWFQLWCRGAYPDLYIGEAFEKIINKEEQPFQQFLSYLPTLFWKEAEKYEIAMLFQIGSGQAIRNLKPYHLLTNKMAHLFLTAKIESPHVCRFTWAFVFACTNNLELCGIISNYLNIGRGWSEEKYQQLKRVEPWLLKLKRWFPRINNQTITPVRELLSYFNHCLQEEIHFRIKGRTYTSMTRLIDQWHLENRQGIFAKRMATKTWEGADYEEWQQTIEGETYQIVQLTTGKELIAEGALMRHCVGSYVGRCAKGHTSIWSLRVQKKSDTWLSLVTIEVTQLHTIRQAKKKYNGKPSLKYRNMIQAWADREGLSW